MIDIIKRYLTQNDCYKEYRKIKPVGIMVHSTGVNNPNISRFVTAPNGWNRPNVQKCVHFFIGKWDGGIGCVQTLPLDCMGWHSGSGSLGWRKNANNVGYIGFEICEDALTDRAYFMSCYKKAVDLCVYLCKKYGWNPLEDGRLICHSEGHKRGIASNHADVMHWFPRHGKSMDTFRADVAKKLSKPEKEENEMTDAEVRKIARDEYAAMREEDNEAKATWEDGFMARAKSMGLMDGTRPKAYITRGEVATVFCNFVDYLVETIGKALK